MTVHVAGAQAVLERIMADPAGPGIIHSAHQGLRDGRWSSEYVASIGQHGVRQVGSWPLEQVAVFAELHGMISSGLVAMVPVSTDGPPHHDSDREGNAAALANLPRPFTASVNMTQNNGDFDGTVSWDEPIEVSLATRLIEREPDGTTRPIPVHYMLPPGEAPLEIGSSLPSRTWMHLTREGGTVARWPYGFSKFRLFVNLDYVNGIERIAAQFHPADVQRAESEATRRRHERVRRACAALGHPRYLTMSEVGQHGGPDSAAAVPIQGSLW